jgi:uncharacterized protein DUF2154
MTARTLAAVVSLGLSGCVVVETDPGPVETYTQDIEVGRAETAHVDIQLGAGDLSIAAGGGKKLVTSSFQYGARLGRPDIHYEVRQSEGRLTIEPPRNRFGTGHASNEWKLRFGDSVPLEFTVQVGAGQSTVDLSHLPVRLFDIQMGAGKLDLNLAGRYRQDVIVSVQGGVGQAAIALPRDFGVIADVKGGIGAIQPGTLVRRNGRFVNRAYDEGRPAIRLTVRGGVGEIRLSEEE